MLNGLEIVGFPYKLFELKFMRFNRTGIITNLLMTAKLLRLQDDHP
jgi:hypothetical protein